MRRLSLARSLLLLPLLSSGMACLPGAADGAQTGVTSAPPAQATAPLAPAPPPPLRRPPPPSSRLPLNRPLCSFHSHAAQSAPPGGGPRGPGRPGGRAHDRRAPAPGLRGGAPRGPAHAGHHPQYTSYLIAYPSDGLRITGYLNVPPWEGPFPVLLVNHGYVPSTGYIAVASNYTKREGDYFATRGTSPPQRLPGPRQ